MEDRPQDEQFADHATPFQSDGRGSRTAGHHPSRDGILLAELAALDELLRERDAGWKELVQRLDALRRAVAVASAQVQRSRSVAARKVSRDDGADEVAKPPAPTPDEARAARLTQEFEAALRETERRRVALHAEMDDLRRRRHALLGRLPTPLSRAYQSLTNAGRVPAIAAGTDGVCAGCESSLPEFVTEVLRDGAVAACVHCERLLRPSGGGK